MVYAFNPCAWKVEAGGSLGVHVGQLDLHSEFQDRQSYTVKPYLKKQQTTQKTTFVYVATHSK